MVYKVPLAHGSFQLYPLHTRTPILLFCPIFAILTCKSHPCTMLNPDFSICGEKETNIRTHSEMWRNEGLFYIFRAYLHFTKSMVRRKNRILEVLDEPLTLHQVGISLICLRWEDPKSFAPVGFIYSKQGDFWHQKEAFSFILVFSKSETTI